MPEAVVIDFEEWQRLTRPSLAHSLLSSPIEPGDIPELEVAHMAVHVGHMTGRDAMGFCFAAVTACCSRRATRSTRSASSRRASRSTRRRIIAETPARVPALPLDGRPESLDPTVAT